LRFEQLMRGIQREYNAQKHTRPLIGSKRIRPRQALSIS
jgi:hypothetical protein